MNIKLYSVTDGPVFTALPPDPSIPWQVDRYSNQVMGGPKSATISAPVTAHKWDAFKLLHCGVEIMNEDGVCVWWGMINKVTIPHEEKQVGLSLDKLVNRVSFKYTEVNENNTVAGASMTTGWADDSISRAQFGTRERIVSSKAQNLDMALAAQASYLSLYGRPNPTIEMGTGSRVILECVGWWETLEWKYYQNTTAASVETTKQIADIITACGQYITQSLISASSGIYTNQARDENLRTGLAEVEELLKAGNNLGRMLTATVTKERAVIVTTIPDPSTQYYLLPDGKLQNPWGGMVPESYCKVGVWVSLRNMPAVLGRVSLVKAFFVDSAEYNASTGSTKYTVLGSEDVMNITALR